MATALDWVLGQLQAAQEVASQDAMVGTPAPLRGTGVNLPAPVNLAANVALAATNPVSLTGLAAIRAVDAIIRGGAETGMGITYPRGPGGLEFHPESPGTFPLRFQGFDPGAGLQRAVSTATAPDPAVLRDGRWQRTGDANPLERGHAAIEQARGEWKHASEAFMGQKGAMELAANPTNWVGFGLPGKAAARVANPALKEALSAAQIVENAWLGLNADVFKGIGTGIANNRLTGPVFQASKQAGVAMFEDRLGTLLSALDNMLKDIPGLGDEVSSIRAIAGTRPTSAEVEKQASKLPPEVAAQVRAQAAQGRPAAPTAQVQQARASSAQERLSRVPVGVVKSYRNQAHQDWRTGLQPAYDYVGQLYPPRHMDKSITELRTAVEAKGGLDAAAVDALLEEGVALAAQGVINKTTPVTTVGGRQVNIPIANTFKKGLETTDDVGKAVRMVLWEREGGGGGAMPETFALNDPRVIGTKLAWMQRRYGDVYPGAQGGQPLGAVVARLEKEGQVPPAELLQQVPPAAPPPGVTGPATTLEDDVRALMRQFKGLDEQTARKMAEQMEVIQPPPAPAAGTLSGRAGEIEAQLLQGGVNPEVARQKAIETAAAEGAPVAQDLGAAAPIRPPEVPSPPAAPSPAVPPAPPVAESLGAPPALAPEPVGSPTTLDYDTIYRRYVEQGMEPRAAARLALDETEVAAPLRPPPAEAPPALGAEPPPASPAAAGEAPFFDQLSPPEVARPPGTPRPPIEPPTPPMPTTRVYGPEPGVLEGPTGQTTTARWGENPVEFRYRVVDLDDLTPSHLDDLRVNPAYPAERQPRGRDRAASQEQIGRIARTLDPRELTRDTGSLSTGPMIIDSSGVVESGNGRILALRRARETQRANYDAYQDAVRAEAEAYGISPDDLANIADPVLVRERITPMEGPDLIRYTVDANESGLLALSTTERALADAKSIPDQVVNGLDAGAGSLLQQINMASNRQSVRDWLGTIPQEAHGALTGEGGALSADGARRLGNAIFARTFDSEAGRRLTTLFKDSPDPAAKVIQTAIDDNLLGLAKLKGGEFDLSDDLAAAIDVFVRIRQQQARDPKALDVRTYLEAPQMFDRELTPFQEQLLRFLDENGNAVARLRNTFREYARVARTPTMDEADLVTRGKGALLDTAIQRTNPQLGFGFEDLEAAAPETPGVGLAGAAGPDLGAEAAGVRASPAGMGPAEAPPSPAAPAGVAEGPALTRAQSRAINVLNDVFAELPEGRRAEGVELWNKSILPEDARELQRRGLIDLSGPEEALRAHPPGLAAAPLPPASVENLPDVAQRAYRNLQGYFASLPEDVQNKAVPLAETGVKLADAQAMKRLGLVDLYGTGDRMRIRPKAQAPEDLPPIGGAAPTPSELAQEHAQLVEASLRLSPGSAKFKSEIYAKAPDIVARYDKAKERAEKLSAQNGGAKLRELADLPQGDPARQEARSILFEMGGADPLVQSESVVLQNAFIRDYARSLGIEFKDPNMALSAFQNVTAVWRQQALFRPAFLVRNLADQVLRPLIWAGELGLDHPLNPWNVSVTSSGIKFDKRQDHFWQVFRRAWQRSGEVDPKHAPWIGPNGQIFAELVGFDAGPKVVSGMAGHELPGGPRGHGPRRGPRRAHGQGARPHLADDARNLHRRGRSQPPLRVGAWREAGRARGAAGSPPRAVRAARRASLARGRRAGAVQRPAQAANLQRGARPRDADARPARSRRSRLRCLPHATGRSGQGVVAQAVHRLQRDHERRRSAPQRAGIPYVRHALDSLLSGNALDAPGPGAGHHRLQGRPRAVRQGRGLQQATVAQVRDPAPRRRGDDPGNRHRPAGDVLRPEGRGVAGPDRVCVDRGAGDARVRRGPAGARRPPRRQGARRDGEGRRVARAVGQDAAADHRHLRRGATGPAPRHRADGRGRNAVDQRPARRAALEGARTAAHLRRPRAQ
jgi:hypothetical protein